MANNRLFLKCRNCGEIKQLLKYYPGTGWYLPDHSTQRLDDWLEEHSHGEASGWGKEPFELEYEIPLVEQELLLTTARQEG